MMISYNWLKQYINLPDSVSAIEVADKLKLATVEVEKVVKQGENLENIVVGKIVLAEKHPDADKLKLCKVDVGGEVLQVVCGGSNVKEGMLVALGKVGAKVKWHGEGDLVELKPTKIRGVESFGMICASTEIGLGEMFPLKDEKEILDLTNVIASDRRERGNPLGLQKDNGIASSVDANQLSRNDKFVGSPLTEALGLDDAILEIDNKSLSNRPDLWGHYGMAREVAALFGKDLKDQKIKRTKDQKLAKGLNLSVQVEDKKLCPRYMVVAIEGVVVKDSPAWLKQKLMAVGLRPINNIVDITNYVVCDLGQPMHAFSAEALNSKLKTQNSKLEIVVRRAKAGEKFTTLDEVERELDENMLMITDGEESLAIAGVMGGLKSGIDNNTKTIIFESANFEATNIRQTSSKLGLRTESSMRFEKALDPNLCEIALAKAVELAMQLCPEAKVVSKVVDIKDFHLAIGPLEMTMDFINKKLGVEIEKKTVIKILESLGFVVREVKDKFKLTIPTWRATKDISIVEDVVEEIARIYGYEKIPAQMPTFSITPPEKNNLRTLERKIKNILSLECSYTEVYNYSFVSPELLKKIGMGTENLIELDNPIAKDRPFLRHNLCPNLLESIEKNQRQADILKLFEIGKVFRKEQSGLRTAENSDELLPRQDTLLCLVCAGKNIEVPFYEVGEAFKNLMKHFNVEVEFKAQEKVEEAFVHAGRQAVVYVNGKAVGAIAELHPITQKNLGLESRVGMLEINLDELLPVLNEEKKYSPLSLYPGVVRDIAFVVDKTITHAEIVGALEKVDPLIVNVELFDVYSGKNLGENKKSMAYHLTYLSAERTLIAEEVDKIQEKVIKKIEKEFGAEVRV